MTRIILFTLCVTLSFTTSARTIPEKKRVLIDQLIELSGANQVATALANAMTQQIVQALAKKHGKIDKAVVQIIHHEAKTIIYEEFVLNNKLNEIFYDLYDEYFTLEQIREVVAFYSSPTGMLAAQVLPKISRRSLEDAKKHGATLGPKIHQRIDTRLNNVKQALEEADTVDTDQQ